MKFRLHDNNSAYLMVNGNEISMSSDSVRLLVKMTGQEFNTLTRRLKGIADALREQDCFLPVDAQGQMRADLTNGEIVQAFDVVREAKKESPENRFSFSQAMEHMAHGGRARLPDWTGVSIGFNGASLRYSHGGDIYSPSFDNYIKKDWILC